MYNLILLGYVTKCEPWLVHLFIYLLLCLLLQGAMAFTIVENVRGFFISRPPLVVFMICLGSFAIALITFAYIVKVKDMPNPDVTEVRVSFHGIMVWTVMCWNWMFVIQYLFQLQ